MGRRRRQGGGAVRTRQVAPGSAFTAPNGTGVTEHRDRRTRRSRVDRCEAETGKGACIRPHDGRHLQPPTDFRGPTIAQLNEIQRLRDATGVICDRPTSREKADRQIAALGAYLEDDVRDAPEHFRPAARPKAEIGVPADVAAEIDQIIARWQAPTLTTGSVLNRLRVTPLPQPSVVRAHLRALVQSRKLRKVGKNRFVRLPDLNAWD